MAYRDNKLYESLVAACTAGCTSKILVLGDSHAGHLGALFEAMRQKNNVSIFLHARGSGINGAPGSGDFIGPVIEHYESTINPEDLIVLSTFSNKGIDSAVARGYEKAIKIAATKKASVILIGPTPYFEKIAPYRLCAKAWFRPAFAIPKNCTALAPRARLANEASGFSQYLTRLTKEHKNVFLYDAFDVLCPQDVKYCTSSKSGRSLYKDSDHLSSYGAESLYPSFTSFLHHNHLSKNMAKN